MAESEAYSAILLDGHMPVRFSFVLYWADLLDKTIDHIFEKFSNNATQNEFIG